MVSLNLLSGDPWYFFKNIYILSTLIKWFDCKFFSILLKTFQYSYSRIQFDICKPYVLLIEKKTLKKVFRFTFCCRSFCNFFNWRTKSALLLLVKAFARSAQNSFEQAFCMCFSFIFRNFLISVTIKYRVTGNAQILEKALFPKLKLTKDLN